MEIKYKVLNYIKNHNLLNKNDSVILAVSGGADSVCMLEILNSLKEEFSLSLYVAHLNHLLRGAESDRDEKYVADLCKKYNIPCYIKRVDINKLSCDLKLSCEEAGRYARYEFFTELKKEISATKIATAHNKCDNIETVLMRFLRGTDVKGLSGIPVHNDLDVIRPLLCLDRTEIEEFLMCKGIDFVTDSTNLTDDYLRNRIRHNLIPQIEKEYNQNFSDTLSNNISLFSEADSFLENYTKSRMKSLAKRDSFGISFCVDELLKEDKYIVKRIIKKTVFELSKSNISNNTVNLIYNSLEKDTRVSINEKTELYVKYGTAFFVSKTCTHEFSHIINNVGSFTIPDTPLVVTVETVSETSISKDKNTIYLPKDKLNQNLILRNRKDGDFMNLSKCGKKKIKDILIDEKIPVFLRDSIPVLEYNGEIIWLYGIRKSTNLKVIPGKEHIKITIHKENKYE